jgi:alkylation response protein AidB-like acyl-CoA dehydrogenase
VNGEKKWITSGTFADYFTVAVRTGGKGMQGISMMLIERSEGLKTRHMKCGGIWASGTSFVTFDNVKVPVENLIGKENEGFKYIMYNFNHERFTIIVQAIRLARCCYEESFHYAQKRKTFGKELIEHQVIRAKLGNMIRDIEACQSWLESLTYQMCKMSTVESNQKLGGSLALLKVQSTKLLEMCAREAVQIFGGLGYSRGGQGEVVERIYRDSKAVTIYGGSEEIMLDLGVRQAIKMNKSKL